MISAKFILEHKTNGSNDFKLDVEFDVSSKGIIAIFGSSGCGKTSLLRAIAGLEKNATGRFSLNKKVWQDNGTNLPTYKRSIGYVFQEASLFEHLTAYGNLNYATKRVKNLSRLDDHETYFQQIIDLMQIEDLLPKYPAQLSGGERQRVAIARALLIRPDLLLMDEPLAALDTARKHEIIPFLLRIRNEFDVPIIYVSHSVDEIIKLADHIIMLKDGKITDQGDVATTLSKHQYIGEEQNQTGAVLNATISKHDKMWHLISAEFDGRLLWLSDNQEKIGQKVRVKIMAKDVSLSVGQNHQETSILNHFRAKICAITTDTHPSMKLVKLKIGDSVLFARISAKSTNILNLELGMSVWAHIKSASILS